VPPEAAKAGSGHLAPSCEQRHTRRYRHRAVDLTRLRHEYESAGLDERDLDPDPLEQFRTWFAEAERAGLVEPHAMTVSTVDADGRPASRYVLLRGLDEAHGFQFFTNLRSAKARDLAEHPVAALAFGWLGLNRQVRVSGRTAELPDALSDAYFAGRPRASRIGAWASPQSEVLPGREALDELVAEAEARFAGVEDVPRPPFWGGYGVRPETIVFWQGRRSRLHDRLRYRRDRGDGWIVERVAP
jgi:pyridoxamine 5'-phosphate oxidase